MSFRTLPTYMLPTEKEVSFLFLELYQVLVLHEGNRDFLGLYVYY